jgi:hypothetical protein
VSSKIPWILFSFLFPNLIVAKFQYKFLSLPTKTGKNFALEKKKKEPERQIIKIALAYRSTCYFSYS